MAWRRQGQSGLFGHAAWYSHFSQGMGSKAVVFFASQYPRSFEVYLNHNGCFVFVHDRTGPVGVIADQ